MVHGSEAVLPTNINYRTPRVRAYTEEGNQVALEDAIDQLNEARDVALLRRAKYQHALRRYHKRNVRPRELHVGDLVLRRIQGSKDRHKLLPPWEGSFIIHEVLRPGTYKIRYQGKDAPRSRATQGTMPSSFLQNFSKNPDNYVETHHTSERFFDGSLIS
jgi:hypothetical protein